MNKNLLRAIGIAVVSILLYLLVSPFRQNVDGVIYRLQYGNPYILEHTEIDEILNSFEQVKINDLPLQLKENVGLQNEPFFEMTKEMSFYVVPYREVHRNVVGDYPISTFVSSDELEGFRGFFSDKPVYWGMDKRVLHKLLDLQNELEKAGWAPDAFYVNSGHRFPYENQDVGGASKSRHILGEAIDIKIGDINKDGRYSDEDKAIVLDICEKKVIADEGGIGRYPGSRSVHIDVRGYRARWDSY